MSANELARRVRVQYPGAIYHVTSRGVQQSSIFRDNDDRIAFFQRCEATVDRFGWLVYSVAQMTNHFHLHFQTPDPNLSEGSQYLLGQYAQGFNRRHGRSGHVFEARYRCHPVEDESYHWSLSRYVHRNPSPAIVEHPRDWRWSSYPGYLDPSRRLPWVCYDELIAAWSAAFGSGVDAYCRYVEGGGPAEIDLADGWVLGSVQFAERMRRMASPDSMEPVAHRARRTRTRSLDEVVQTVCAEFSISPQDLLSRSCRHPARNVFATIAHRHATATLEEIAQRLGLAGRDSVHKKIQRGELLEAALRDRVDRIEQQLDEAPTREAL